MNFEKAMILAACGTPVGRMNKDNSSYFLKGEKNSNGYGDDSIFRHSIPDGNVCLYSPIVSDIHANDWVVLGPKLKFAEIIEGLYAGKRYRREIWHDPVFIKEGYDGQIEEGNWATDAHSRWQPTITELKAEDWLEFLL